MGIFKAEAAEDRQGLVHMLPGGEVFLAQPVEITEGGVQISCQCSVSGVCLRQQAQGFQNIRNSFPGVS